MGRNQKKWQHAATRGNKTEEYVDNLATEAGLTWDIDKTVDGKKIRKKDKKCDRVYKVRINNQIVNVPVEIKHAIKGRSISFQLTENELTKVDIKYHQLKAAKWFIFIWDDVKPIRVNKKVFWSWAWFEVNKRSINYKDALSIGEEFETMDWVATEGIKEVSIITPMPLNKQLTLNI